MKIDFTSLHGHIGNLFFLASEIKDNKLKDSIGKELEKLDNKLIEMDEKMVEVAQSIENIRGKI